MRQLRCLASISRLRRALRTVSARRCFSVVDSVRAGSSTIRSTPATCVSTAANAKPPQRLRGASRARSEEPAVLVRAALRARIAHRAGRLAHRHHSSRGLRAFLDHAEQRYSRSHADAEALFYLAQGYLLRSTYRLEHDKGVFGAARDAAKAKGYADTYIKQHPEHGDAYLVLGLYNYYVDIAPNFIKVLRVLLFLPSGNRAEGLKQLERAAAREVCSRRWLKPRWPTSTARSKDGRRSDRDRRTAGAALPGQRGHAPRSRASGTCTRRSRRTISAAAAVHRGDRSGEWTVCRARAARYQATLGLANLRRSQWRLDEAIALLTPAIDQHVAKPGMGGTDVSAPPRQLSRAAQRSRRDRRRPSACSREQDDRMRIQSRRTADRLHRGAAEDRRSRHLRLADPRQSSGRGASMGRGEGRVQQRRGSALRATGRFDTGAPISNSRAATTTLPRQGFTEIVSVDARGCRRG